MGFTIRKAKRNDCPLIFSLIRELAIYEKLEREVVATVEELEKTLFGDNTFVEVYIGYEGENPVGFCLIFQNYSTFLGRPGIYLEDLFVKETHRGKGYGKKMLQFLARLAVERNCGRFEWSVLDWNKPAIDFYKNLGAREMDEWTVYRVSGEALKKLAGVN